jgi:hypothetical protein
MDDEPRFASRINVSAAEVLLSSLRRSTLGHYYAPQHTMLDATTQLELLRTP